eukprot:Gregarina_sp_Poly_1__785@NODE_1189_length_4822_cov_141_095689_g818_i0_p2_GENE_NODE_1189_length_4822_cov_141_095689_g818_i0NODE_1189_length_4822_cov_141_095689_g818_i0_p2_ORF_typecomplete_len354_score15_96PAP2/PF01569_21/2_2e02PAP2/PF01569_21/1_9e25PAP2_3/PF14378_6/1_5e05DUF202/PF02656_15/17DUF202/PF02656_15/0_56CD34_antigen/PF06365_12/0_62CD34_antigen/PF06365_12/1_2e03YfhO/PF09586_10/1_2e02YfhO/PF09586_10/0_26FUSC/PF04632_12/3_5e03FUSC/PF04632_12/0_07_NODE_1189_length_4822_cov_141_095689_g818_i0
MKGSNSTSKNRFCYDWIFIGNEIAVRIVTIAIGIIFEFSYPVFIREVQGKDWPDYAYPYREHQMFSETLATAIIAITCAAILLAGVLLLRYYCRWPWRLCMEEAVLFILGGSLAASLNFMSVTMIKKMYGRLRPDFLSRCYGHSEPSVWMVANDFKDWSEVPDVPECNDLAGSFNLSSRALEDGRMSFPSGHTSFSYSLVGFAALWAYSKLCLLSNWGSWRIAIPFLLMMIPTAIAVSRTSDYRHHSSDIVGGMFLGIGIATLCFCFYFPLVMPSLATALYKCHAKRTPTAKLIATDAAKISTSLAIDTPKNVSDTHFSRSPLEGPDFVTTPRDHNAIHVESHTPHSIVSQYA